MIQADPLTRRVDGGAEVGDHASVSLKTLKTLAAKVTRRRRSTS